MYHCDGDRAAKFATVLKTAGAAGAAAGAAPLVFFSGDVLGPSVPSSITKGAHMIPVLNELGISAAVIGNRKSNLATVLYNVCVVYRYTFAHCLY